MKRIICILCLVPFLLGISPMKGPTDLGNEAYKKGEYEQALKHYGEAADSDPDEPAAHYNLGNAYYKLGDYERAAAEYGKARELDPDMADAYYNAGDSLFRMERYEDALKAYESAKSMYGKDEDTEHNIEITAERIKKKQEQQQKKQQSGKKKGKQDKDGKDKQQGGGTKGAQQGAGQKQAQGPPPMSNEELQALMERQAYEEKKLRNYFRPGKQDEQGRESEIEQMLRGMGMGPLERDRRPGEPFVERDW